MANFSEETIQRYGKKQHPLQEMTRQHGVKTNAELGLEEIIMATEIVNMGGK